MNFSSNINLTQIFLTSIAIVGLSTCDRALAVDLSTPKIDAIKSVLIAKQPVADSLANSQIVQYTFPQEQISTIDLHPGLGTNISFDAVDQTVESIFLDNQSFISINTNGCIVKTELQKCPAGSIPTLVHVSLIDDIDLPGVIRVNQRAKQKSLLTIVTNNPRGQKQTYIFSLKLFASKGSRPHVALIRIVPPAPKTATSAPVNLATSVGSTFVPVNIRVTDRLTIDYFTTGFRLAVNRGDYKLNFPQYESINKFIAALNGGAKLDSAATYGLKLDLVANLVSLGTPPQS
jgi:hypothetical protein